LIVLLVFLLVIDSHADSEILTGLAAADIVCLVFGYAPRSLVVRREYLPTDNFISLRVILIIVPLDPLYYSTIACVINRSARTFDHNMVIGIVVLPGRRREEIVVIAILLVAGKAQVDPFEFSHGLPTNMASFRLRLHGHSLAPAVVPAEDELRDVNKSAAIADKYNPTGLAMQLANLFDQPTAAKRAVCLSVSSLGRIVLPCYFCQKLSASVGQPTALSLEQEYS
jgi:hypothetical protein